MIPVAWKEYTCTVSGGTVKFVECEECSQKFVYHMVREAQGQGSSLYFLDNAGAEGRAQNAAQTALQKQLTAECDAIPCPKCGLFQEEMVDRLRRKHRIWMYWTGLGLFFTTIICASIGWIAINSSPPSSTFGGVMMTLAGLQTALGVGLIIYRKVMGDALDPNNLESNGRQRLAEGSGEAVASFKQWLKENGIDLPEDDAAETGSKRKRK